MEYLGDREEKRVNTALDIADGVAIIKCDRELKKTKTKPISHSFSKVYPEEVV